VLNAKPENIDREAEIVAQAGRYATVTIATNMAGRGTDIILGGNPEYMAMARLKDKYATRLDVPEEEWEIGAVRVRAQPVNHPGPTVGYRIEDEGKVLTYISDHEPALGIDLRTVEPDWISGYALAYGSDVLLHDAQYTEDEYPGRVGWGHSSIAHMVTFALITKTRRLIMFHHDPLHSDAQLEAMLVRAKELWGQDADGVSLSYEGMEIDIS